MYSIDELAEMHYAAYDPEFANDDIVQDAVTGEDINVYDDDYVEVWDGFVLRENLDEYMEQHPEEFEDEGEE